MLDSKRADMSYSFCSMSEVPIGPGNNQEVQKPIERPREEGVGKVLRGAQEKLKGVLSRGRNQAPALHGSVAERRALLSTQNEIRNFVASEQQPQRNARRLDTSTINAVAEGLRRQGHQTLADELQQSGPSQEEIRQNQHEDHENWFR